MVISNEILNRCLYFGCWEKRVKGHFLVDRYNRSVRKCVYHEYNLTFRELYWLDGVFDNTREQSKAQLIHLPGWTFMSMPDYSVDDRPGSNAAFLVPIEKLNVAEVLEIARVAFKAQVERIEAVAPIVEFK